MKRDDAHANGKMLGCAISTNTGHARARVVFLGWQKSMFDTKQQQPGNDPTGSGYPFTADCKLPNG